MSENVNFHMTFPPTPAYIGRLLKIADGRVRTVAEIAEETGIPEGASSGKSPSTYSVCKLHGVA